MKKIFLIITVLLVSVYGYAQEEFEDFSNSSLTSQDTAKVDSLIAKQALEDSLLVKKMKDNSTSHNINFYFGVGMNTMAYDPLEGDWKPSHGGDFRLQYQVMFNKHWGLAIGAQATVYQSAAIYNYSFQHLNLVHPDNGLLYDQTITFNDWKEKQLMLQVEVPIMFNYRHFINKKTAFLLGAGASLAFPVYSTYKTVDGNYTITGYFPSTNVTYSNIVEHGFSSTKYGDDGDHNYNAFNVGAIIDLGFTFKMTRISDFYLGLYGGYYFLNTIDHKDQELILRPTLDAPGKYVGTFCSDRVKEVHPFNFGIRLGFMFRVDQADKKAKAFEDRLAQARKDRKDLELMKLKHQQDSLDALNLAAQSAEDAEAARRRLERESAEKNALDAEFQALRAEHDSLLKKKAEIQERKRIAGHINSIAHFDSAQDFPYMDEEAADALKKLADLMRKNPNVIVMVFGHADSSGNSDQNIIYGQRRAEAMKTILVKHGADPSRIICVSRGDKDPVASNDTPEGRKLNRRAEIDIRED
ncbi:MAG: OmpA family protein [Paludibacteraceae bacterium]|nr:OmpA family protein [Paludibacteraceae bacterium]